MIVSRGKRKIGDSGEWIGSTCAYARALKKVRSQIEERGRRPLWVLPLQSDFWLWHWRDCTKSIFGSGRLSSDRRRGAVTAFAFTFRMQSGGIAKSRCTMRRRAVHGRERVRSIRAAYLFGPHTLAAGGSFLQRRARWLPQSSGLSCFSGNAATASCHSSSRERNSSDVRASSTVLSGPANSTRISGGSQSLLLFEDQGRRNAVTSD